MVKRHRCSKKCICPECGEAQVYAPSLRKHACAGSTCRRATLELQVLLALYDAR